LGMRGGQREHPFFLVGEFLGNLLDVLDLAQNLPGGMNDAFARRSYTRQVLAATGEHFQPQFIFQQANLLADSWLRRVEALGSSRHVQIMVCHLPDVTQLLKLHGRSSNVTAAMWLAVSYNHINPTRQKTTETSIKKPYRCRENVAAPTSSAKQPDGNDR